MDLRLRLAPATVLFFLVHFVSPYELPSNYFINCGSDTSAILFRQNYSPDVNFFSPAQASSLKTSPSESSSVESLYQTARFHTRRFSYRFRFAQNGTYLLRLHFHSFSTTPQRNFNLSDARFDVSISGTPLLSNFGVPKSGSTVLQEFLLTADCVDFDLRVDFSPTKGSSLAFVSAIEAFAAPDNLIGGSTPTLVARQGNANGTTFHLLQRNMLRSVYKINMGGGRLTPENDTLNRYWDPDHAYLFTPDAAEKSAFRSLEPAWNPGFSDRFIAPELVYQTAKQLNLGSTNSFNLTWKFEVAENARHFVRSHFCNIMGESLNEIVFNFFIDGYFGVKVETSRIVLDLDVPFYKDFVVESDQSGVMSISIGSRSESQRMTAFLNGLEIMELMDSPRLSSGRQSRSKSALLVILGSVAGGVVLIMVSFLVLFFGVYRRKVKRPLTSWPENDKSSHNRVVEATLHLPNLNLGLKIPISEIILATNDFDRSLMIGEGGFGKVYQGVLQDGTKVAVKRSEPGHGQGLPEFHTEIIILSKIRHVHLVSLIGYCDELSEMILVYEFMEKGTLREHLYGESENPRANLSWEKRLEICIGSARGLHYLHAGASGGIIHRDVKSTNILLDQNYVAKVADFGLSSVLDQSHVSTGIKGSFGYLDPEYFRTLQLTEKSDVYSFGVVLLEVVCARPAIKKSQQREEINLAEWEMLWHKKGQLQNITDPFLAGKINPNSLRVFGETAAKCLRAYGADRPSMGEVIWDLEYSLQLQHTGAPGDPYECSTTGSSSLELPLMKVQNLPSHSMKTDEDMSTTFNNSERTTASDIFSQLRIDGGR